MTCLIVIPARWGSTRLPGKPLIPIAGRPLLARVLDVARAAMRELDDVDLVVATDDHRVRDLAGDLGCRVAMTPPTLTSGSARALAAAVQEPSPPATVVNLQGDAPFIPPASLAAVVRALDAGARVATPVQRLNWDELDALRRHKQQTPFSGTTCTVAPDGTASWFSKQILPGIRDEETWRTRLTNSPVLQHLGLYGYTLEALVQFEAAPPSLYEELEGLEQLRFLHLGIPIRVIEIEQLAPTLGGIDTPADVERAERLIAAIGERWWS